MTLERRLADINQRGSPLISLSVCQISCDFFTDDGRLRSNEAGFLNLECLDALRAEGVAELFFPPHRMLFIRQSMEAIFARLTSEKRDVDMRVLIGSPGVGKSILFFLAALRKALVTESKVLFLRRTSEEAASVFIMEPSGQGDCLNVFFSRGISKAYFTLTDVCRDLSSKFPEFKGPKSAQSWTTFVDGPNHADIPNTLDGSYDYFCTSGGYPLPKQSQLLVLKVWVLSGWKESEMLKALKELASLEEANAVEIYKLCGGSIRLALVAVSEGLEFVRNTWRRLVDVAPTAAKALAIRSNQRTEGRDNYDRMRTMFEGPPGNVAIQLVDSEFLLSLLKMEAAVSQLRHAYQLATVVGLASVRGGLFEELMHRWFETTNLHPIVGSLRSRGNGRDGVRSFNKSNTYWIPSISNFANIDAAFVCQETLVCLQYTVSQMHSFDKNSFLRDLISPLREAQTLVFQKIEIYFVVPIGTSFQDGTDDYCVEVAKVGVPPGHATRSGGALDTLDVTFTSIEVDPSTDSLIEAMIQMAIPCLSDRE